MNHELKEARKLAKELAKADRWNEEQRRMYATLKKVFVAAGQCPACYINDGTISPLGKMQPGNREEYAGRACSNCEEFFPCGEQPEYELDTWMGDADSGL